MNLWIWFLLIIGGAVAVIGLAIVVFIVSALVTSNLEDHINRG